MTSRIRELESSLSALEHDLKQVQNKEAEAKLAAEKATEDIDRLKEETQGKFGVCCFIKKEFGVCCLYVVILSR